MLSDLQKRKLTRLFGVIDSNGDGSVEAADYLRVATTLASAYGREPGSAEHQKLVAGYGFMWSTLNQMADANQDGKVSLPEYLAAYEKLLASGDPFSVLAMAIRSMLDPDGDGKVSRTEYVTVLGAYGIAEADASAWFGRLDENGDGTLTLGEVKTCVQEFFFSSDPNARGNWLVGPIGN